MFCLYHFRTKINDVYSLESVVFVMIFFFALLGKIDLANVMSEIANVEFLYILTCYLLVLERF